MMKCFWILVLSPCLILGQVWAATPGASGGGNQITTDVPDAGGQRTTTSGIVVDQSFETVTGISSGGNITVRHGFIGQLYEGAPTIVSGGGVVVSPTSGVEGAQVTFSINASDEDPFTISWDFGDGQTDTSNSASIGHTFATPGTFTVTVTLTDADGQSTSSSLTYTVIKAIDPNDIDDDGIPNDQDLDDDNDGESDLLEAALGTDPLDANSTTLTAAIAANPEALVITKMRIKVNAVKDGTDALILIGTVDVPDDYDPTGVRMAFDIGGIIRIFTLDEKGKQKIGTDKILLKVRKKKKVVLAQAAILKLKIARTTFRDILADENINADATFSAKAGETRTIVVSLIFPDEPKRFLKKAQVGIFSSKAGKLSKIK